MVTKVAVRGWMWKNLPVIYSRQFNLLFTHVSRTGGISIAEYLRPRLPDFKSILGLHAPLAHARPLLAPHFDETLKFAFVRNPWERFVSWFALCGKAPYGTKFHRETSSDPESRHWRGFDAFLEARSAEWLEIDGVPRRTYSQWAHLADAEDRLLTDHLGRFETLAEDAARFFAIAGLAPGPLPRLNTALHHHYSVYYSAFGRELVEQLFPEDVSRLGYRFGPPAGP